MTVTTCSTVASSHLQTDRREEAPTHEKKVSTGLKVRSPPRKALFSLRHCLDRLIPLSPLWISGKNNRVVRHQWSPVPLHTPLSSITSQEWNEIENASFQSASEGDPAATGKQGSTHRRHTWVIPKDPLSTSTSGSRCLPNNLLFLQDPGNIGQPGAW